MAASVRGVFLRLVLVSRKLILVAYDSRPSFAAPRLLSSHRKTRG